jgi:hypothetical protein
MAASTDTWRGGVRGLVWGIFHEILAAPIVLYAVQIYTGDVVIKEMATGKFNICTPSAMVGFLFAVPPIPRHLPPNDKLHRPTWQG